MKKSVLSGVPGRASLSALVLAFVLSGLAQAQGSDADAGKQLLREFSGSDDTDALLRHPKVRPQLQELLGSELPHPLNKVRAPKPSQFCCNNRNSGNRRLKGETFISLANI
jgi:hypothetical protein